MERLWRFAAHLGVGLLPGPTGTWGSALGAGLFALLHWLWPSGGGLALLIGAVCLGVRASGRAELTYGRDAKEIVIDEVAGQALALWLALLLLPASAWSFLLGFLLFRFFDIAKLWPVSRAENLPGGWGVMGDDLLAGLMAGGVMLAGGWLIL